MVDLSKYVVLQKATISPHVSSCFDAALLNTSTPVGGALLRTQVSTDTLDKTN